MRRPRQASGLSRVIGLNRSLASMAESWRRGHMKQSVSETEGKLKLEFARFREDPSQRFTVKLRQGRARKTARPRTG